MNKPVYSTFAPGFIATYFHAKPLLAAPKIQEATLIVETSENEAILESIRDGGSENSSELTKCHHTLYQTKLGSWDVKGLHSKLVFDTTTKPEAYPIASFSVVGR